MRAWATGTNSTAKDAALLAPLLAEVAAAHSGHSYTVARRGAREGSGGSGTGCRSLQAACRQAGLQKRFRPTGTNSVPHTPQAIVTPSSRNVIIGIVDLRLVLAVGRRRQDVEVEAAAASHPQDLVPFLACPGEHVSRWLPFLGAQPSDRDHAPIERCRPSQASGDVVVPSDPELALGSVLFAAQHAPAEPGLNPCLVDAQAFGRFS